jgi:hypothetical protein
MIERPGIGNLIGSSTLANTHLSLVAGTVFVDILGLDLTPFIGGSITILDAASKPLVLQLIALGTGETYGTEKLTTWTNSGTPYGTFISAGKDITSAIYAGGGTALANYNAFVSVLGALYRYAPVLTLNSGQVPIILIYSGLGSQAYFNSPLVAGQNTLYYTEGVGGATGQGFLYNTAAANWAATNTLKQVLTPSATGATATIVSKDAAFDPNSATGFTYSITPDNWDYRMGQHGFFKSA